VIDLNVKSNFFDYFLVNLFLFVSLIINSGSAGDIKGKVHLAESKSSANVLIYIEHAEGSFAPSVKPSVIDQKDFMFIPEVLPILAGTTVDFLNSDSVLHNVFTPTKCAGNFNLGTWPKGEFRSHTFNDTNCIVTILCDVHPNMQAWIVVLQNPYFVKTDSAGYYEIKNIPKGRYELKVWRAFYKTKSVPVEIKDSGIVRKDFSLKK
jgi:plastocyanin